MILVCDFFVISREVYEKKSVNCPSNVGLTSTVKPAQVFVRKRFFIFSTLHLWVYLVVFFRFMLNAMGGSHDTLLLFVPYL